MKNAETVSIWFRDEIRLKTTLMLLKGNQLEAERKLAEIKGLIKTTERNLKQIEEAIEKDMSEKEYIKSYHISEDVK